MIFATHISAETSCRILVRTRGLCHVTKFRVEHIATQTQLICGFRQEARSTEHVKLILSIHAFARRQICSCFVNNTSLRECVQLASELPRERVVDGRQATAHVVSCDTAESYTNFLQSSEILYGIDAGSTVMGPTHRGPLSWQILQFRKLRSRPTNMGQVAKAGRQDLSFSMQEALTDACTLRAK